MLVKANASVYLDQIVEADKNLWDFGETMRKLKWTASTIIDKAKEPDHEVACHHINNVEAIIDAMTYISTSHRSITAYKGASRK